MTMEIKGAHQQFTRRKKFMLAYLRRNFNKILNLFRIILFNYFKTFRYSFVFFLFIECLFRIF